MKDVKCIIFVQRRVAAVVLASLVNSLECLSNIFCGGWMSGSSLTREQQQRTLDAFREGKVEWASYPSEERNHITWAWRCKHQQIGQIPLPTANWVLPVVMIHMILYLLFFSFLGAQCCRGSSLLPFDSNNIYVKVDVGTSSWLLDFVLILYCGLWTGESFGCYWCCRRRLGRPRL